MSSKLQLSRSKLSINGGETGRRRSRSREEKQDLKRRSSTTTLNKKTKEKQLNRSQSCAQLDKLGLENFLLDQTKNNALSKKDEQIRNDQKRRKKTRSKSTAFEFRDVFKHQIANFDQEKSLFNIDLNMKQKTLDSKPGPGKALRRIKTFLSKSRKYQFDSEDKFSASSKYHQ